MSKMILMAALLLCTACASQKENRRTEMFVDKVMGRYDLNGDNKIDASEINRNKARQFAGADTDGNGFLNSEETDNAMDKMVSKKKRGTNITLYVYGFRGSDSKFNGRTG